MLRKIIALVLVVLLGQTILAAPVSGSGGVVAQEAQLIEQVKGKVARAGLGEKARVTVKLKNGTKVKGYVSEARDGEFVVRDRKTDGPTTIRYDDVAKVEINRGHSTAKNVTIGVVAGVGAVILTLAILFASLD